MLEAGVAHRGGRGRGGRDREIWVWVNVYGISISKDKVEGAVNVQVNGKTGDKVIEDAIGAVENIFRGGFSYIVSYRVFESFFLEFFIILSSI